jgi:2,4-dienoyl-CoA reductase-like NADH-dependent reductase (Old Yellow Enzyme family)
VVDARSTLFTPLAIRGLTLDNRFVMSPMNRDASPNGVPSEELARYFRRRVDGETGLIVTGGVGIDHPAALGSRAGRPCVAPELHGDALPGWRRVVDLVHAGGGKIVPQLWHMGPLRLEGTGYHPDAPTAHASSLTDAEIGTVIAAYGRSARYAAAAGFDGVAIHGANGNLPDAFFWLKTNPRTDRWGGDRRERSRFASEVVRAIRAEVGGSLPIFFRFSQWTIGDYERRLADTPAELEELLGPLADAGVDVFDASQLDFDRPEFAGSELSLAGWAKKLTGRFSMSVGSVGLSRGIYDREAAVALDNLDAVARRFERGEFDLIAVGRALAHDPAWTRNVRLGLPPTPYSLASLKELT